MKQSTNLNCVYEIKSNKKLKKQQKTAQQDYLIFQNINLEKHTFHKNNKQFICLKNTIVMDNQKQKKCYNTSSLSE